MIPFWCPAPQQYEAGAQFLLSVARLGHFGCVRCRLILLCSWSAVPGVSSSVSDRPSLGKGGVVDSLVWLCAFFSRPDLLEVQDGASSGQVDAQLPKNPLAPEAGGCCSLHSPLWEGGDEGWALHQGPVSRSSDARGSGAAKESIILLSITSGTSYAQTLIPVLTADGRSHPRGCLIGTLKIKSQVLIAALGSGACNSGMLGGDFPPPEHCIGDTNICGASWVCAVTPHSCFTPASGEGPSQGRKKAPGGISAGIFLQLSCLQPNLVSPYSP